MVTQSSHHLYGRPVVWLYTFEILGNWWNYFVFIIAIYTRSFSVSIPYPDIRYTVLTNNGLRQRLDGFGRPVTITGFLQKKNNNEKSH